MSVSIGKIHRKSITLWQRMQFTYCGWNIQARPDIKQLR